MIIVCVIGVIVIIVNIIIGIIGINDEGQCEVERWGNDNNVDNGDFGGSGGDFDFDYDLNYDYDDEKKRCCWRIDKVI